MQVGTLHRLPTACPPLTLTPTPTLAPAQTLAPPGHRLVTAWPAPTLTLTPTNPDPNPDQLEMVGFVPVLLYFGYMMMVSLLFFLGAGTIGFLSSWWFVWKIYGAVKVD